MPDSLFKAWMGLRRYLHSLRQERGFERVANWVGRLLLVNFALYAGFTNYVGGEGLGHGYEAGGRFFLQQGSRAPVEVSETLFKASYWYSVFFLTHFALALLLGFLLARREGRPFFGRNL